MGIGKKRAVRQKAMFGVHNTRVKELGHEARS